MFDEAELPDDPVERAKFLENLMIARATGDLHASKPAYSFLRTHFINRHDTKPLLPAFVRTNHNLDAFWPWIKSEGGTYAERRRIISEAFTPLLEGILISECVHAIGITAGELTSSEKLWHLRHNTGYLATAQIIHFDRTVGKPMALIRCDNGPEFIAQNVRDWIAAVGAKTAYIEPGSPWENGYCESFNARFRDELLNGEIFYTLKEARIVIEQWRKHYNTVRPHSALGYQPPAPESIVPMDQLPTMH